MKSNNQYFFCFNANAVPGFALISALMIYSNTEETTMNEEEENERHRELFESPIHPLQINVVPLYVDVSNKMFCLQVNGEVLWK